MSIGAQVVLADVTIRDIAREALIWRHSKKSAERAARETISAVGEALEDEVIPRDSKVAKLVRARIAKLSSKG